MVLGCTIAADFGFEGQSQTVLIGNSILISNDAQIWQCEQRNSMDLPAIRCSCSIARDDNHCGRQCPFRPPEGYFGQIKNAQDLDVCSIHLSHSCPASVSSGLQQTILYRRLEVEANLQTQFYRQSTSPELAANPKCLSRALRNSLWIEIGSCFSLLCGEALCTSSVEANVTKRKC
jgi:hypothetical protein